MVSGLPQNSRLIHTGLQPGVKVHWRIENRFNGSPSARHATLCAQWPQLLNSEVKPLKR